MAQKNHTRGHSFQRAGGPEAGKSPRQRLPIAHHTCLQRGKSCWRPPCARILTRGTILAATLAPISAPAAAPQYCVLWAREDVRITLLSTNDVDLITAIPELIRRMFDRRYAWCVSQKADYLGLPGGDRRLTDAWVAFMAERIIGKRQPEPVGDAPEPVVEDPEPEVANEAAKPPAAKETNAPIAMSMSGFPVGSPNIWIGAGPSTGPGMRRRAP